MIYLSVSGSQRKCLICEIMASKLFDVMVPSLGNYLLSCTRSCLDLTGGVR